MQPEWRDECLRRLREIAQAAGREILACYADPACAARDKSDGSPVTAADERADLCIRGALAAMTPEIPVVTEECVADLSAQQRGGRFWLVDPLDGTREFIARNGEFTVNIALIEHGVPAMGVVHAPALGCSFWGALGAGAFSQDTEGARAITCRRPGADGWVVLASRSHGDNDALAQFLQSYGPCTLLPKGSSLKFCLIAAGQADLYPRLGRTMEWDTAAGHAVLLAAGGEVATIQGEPLRYGKPGYANPHFVARGSGAA
ncbi:MAG: 3'(2'),5'-bisphosphate nucleotidase CysQ [Ramlibacter sp.]|nr:3'(2'),5'-bisphosphate nucleotidase CysQ [Ramlibacter sp.]